MGETILPKRRSSRSIKRRYKYRRFLRYLGAQQGGGDAVDMLERLLKKSGGTLSMSIVHRKMKATRAMAMGVTVEDLIRESGKRIRYDRVCDCVKYTPP